MLTTPSCLCNHCQPLITIDQITVLNLLCNTYQQKMKILPLELPHILKKHLLHHSSLCSLYKNLSSLCFHCSYCHFLVTIGCWQFGGHICLYFSLDYPSLIASAALPQKKWSQMKRNICTKQKLLFQPLRLSKQCQT